MIALAKVLVVACCAAAVLFQPLAQTVKYAEAARFNHLSAQALFADTIAADDLVLAGSDRYLMLFLDRLQAQYAGAPGTPAYWVLPYVFASPELERPAMDAFACLLKQTAGHSPVWMFPSEAVRMDGADVDLTVVSVNRLRVRVHVDKVLYDAKGTLAVRGEALQLTLYETAYGTMPAEILYAPDHPPACP